MTRSCGYVNRGLYSQKKINRQARGHHFHEKNTTWSTNSYLSSGGSFDSFIQTAITITASLLPMVDFLCSMYKGWGRVEWGSIYNWYIYLVARLF